MMLATRGFRLPVIWIVIGALLVVRVAIGVGRRNRRQSAAAPVSAAGTPRARRHPAGGRADGHGPHHAPRGPRAHGRLRVEGGR